MTKDEKTEKVRMGSRFQYADSNLSKPAPTGKAYFAREGRRLFGGNRWADVDDALNDDEVEE